MEGQSQPQKDLILSESDRILTLGKLYAKAKETKTCSAKAAGHAYRDIMKEVNRLNSDHFDTPSSLGMDYQIFATLVRKSREAVEKECRFGPFDDDQFAAKLGLKYFKTNDGNWCRDQGKNWVNLGSKYTHLIKTARGLDYAHGSFDAKNEPQAKPTKSVAKSRQIVEIPKAKTYTKKNKLTLETSKKRNLQESFDSESTNSSKSRRISIEMPQSPENQNTSRESLNSVDLTTLEDSDLEIEDQTIQKQEQDQQIQTRNGSSEQEVQTQENSANLEEISKVFCSMTESLLNKDHLFETKMYCVCAIDSMISRNSKTCQYITKKEIVDELGNLYNEVLSKVGNYEDLAMIARILAKIDLSHEGKKLLGEMNMSFNAFQRLNAEMKKFQFNLDVNDIVFESDDKSRIKSEVQKIKQE